MFVTVRHQLTLIVGCRGQWVGGEMAMDKMYESKEFREFEAYIESNLQGVGGEEVDLGVEDEEVKRALDVLVEAIRGAEGAVFVYTGAGISCAAGLPSYRGPEGVWTKAVKGKIQAGADADADADGADENIRATVTGEGDDDDDDQEDHEEDHEEDKLGYGLVSLLETVKPTKAHVLLARMVDEGLVSCVATTNVDGLHADTGLVRGETLAQLHGSYYTGACLACGHIHQRSKGEGVLEARDPESRGTGISCPACRDGELASTIVGFFDTYAQVPSMEAAYDVAWVAASQARVCLVLGSSLSVETACSIPDYTVEAGGDLFIVNLQDTVKDGMAKECIRCGVDEVLEYVYARVRTSERE